MIVYRPVPLAVGLMRVTLVEADSPYRAGNAVSNRLTCRLGRGLVVQS